MTAKRKNLEILVEEKDEMKNMCGVEFPINKLIVNGKEIDQGTKFRTLEVKGKNKEILVYYKGTVIDCCIPIAYKECCQFIPVQKRKGVGPQYKHEIIVYNPESKKKEAIFYDNDDGTMPEEWEVNDMKIHGKDLLVSIRNNYVPEKSETKTFSLDKFIKLEKKKKTSEIDPEEAKSLIDRIGACLGYDYNYDPVYPETRKDVCAVRRMTENGSTYGYDTIYLLWKNKSGLNYESLVDSKSTKDYLSVEEIKEDKNKIVVKVDGVDYKRSKKELGLK